MRGIVRVQVLSTSKRTGLTEVLGYVTANLHKLPLDLQVLFYPVFVVDFYNCPDIVEIFIR